MEKEPANCNENGGGINQENGAIPVGDVDQPPVLGADAVQNGVHNGNENSPGTPPPPQVLNPEVNGEDNVQEAPAPPAVNAAEPQIQMVGGVPVDELPSQDPLNKMDPLYYDIYPPHVHYVYHVEVGRNLTTGLNKGQLEFIVRTVIHDNLPALKTYLGRELRYVFPELSPLVTTLKIFREKNTQSRLADILASESSPDLPSGSSSLNSSRQRLNSDSKSRPIRRSTSPQRKGPLKATKNEKPSTPANSMPITNGVGENETNRCFRYHVFDLFREEGEAEQLMQEQMDYEDEHIDPTVHSNHFIVPREEWLGIWDSLYFEDEAKERLFQYISSALLFSAKKVDTTFVTFNKVIMLHGPPGCGKTTLCKAIAQRCSVRFSHRYEGVQLLEVNSHSLFSKWFSESGKLVNRMFDKIFEMVGEQRYLVILLIDEVESLAQCRQAAIHGFEPTDSVRAVNALLVNIDKLSQYPNVVVMATSNIVGGIDIAFLDRADIKMYLGPPPTEVVYGVLASSLNELLNSRIIAPVGTLGTEFLFPTSMHDERAKNNSDPNYSKILKLIKMAKMANGFSGRALRKICFLAHARFFNSVGIDLDTFLNALRVTIQAEMEENDRVNKQRNVSTTAPRLLTTPQRF